MAGFLLKIENCADCMHHMEAQLATGDSFEHEFALYCKRTPDFTDSYERYTYSGRINYKFICADDWEPKNYSEVPGWCPFIMERYQALLGSLHTENSKYISGELHKEILKNFDHTTKELCKISPYIKRDPSIAISAKVALAIGALRDFCPPDEIRKKMHQLLFVEEDIENIISMSYHPGRFFLKEVPESNTEKLIYLSSLLGLFTFKNEKKLHYKISAVSLQILGRSCTKHRKYNHPGAILNINAKIDNISITKVGQDFKEAILAIRKICESYGCKRFYIRFNGNFISWQDFLGDSHQS